MFKEYLSNSSESSAISGMSLNGVWYVDADDSYVRKPVSGRGFVTLRTLDGSGVLSYKDGRVVELGSNSLICFRFENIKEYRCNEDKWQFWWFEFEVYGFFDFPLDKLQHILLVNNEIDRLNQIFLRLNSHESAGCRFATAAFCFLLYEYRLKYHFQQGDDPYRDDIINVIRLMHERLDVIMCVPMMASTANMSERNFRIIFKKITGKSPREFYFEVRMRQGLNFLRRGNSIGEVSKMLGFSSQFYFSNAFQRHFGVRPSHIESLDK